MKKFLNVAYWSVFLFYAFLLIDTVFFARDARQSINLVPFDMIADQGFSLNVWGNIVIFIPVGIYLSNMMGRFNFWKLLGAVMGTSFAIEVLQYILKRGASDIDDVLLNTLGGFIGIVIYLIFKAIFKSKERVHSAISILSLVVGTPVIILVILLVVNN